MKDWVVLEKPDEALFVDNDSLACSERDPDDSRPSGVDRSLIALFLIMCLGAGVFARNS